MDWYTDLARPIAFRFDPERVHNLGIRSLHWIGRMGLLRKLLRDHYAVVDSRLESNLGGLGFPTPVGLAAGYDKNGSAIAGLAALGFGFLEVGSISADASDGNPKPRLFRLPEHEAIIVYYGLPNEGAPRIVERLKCLTCPVPVGVNLVNTNRLRIEEEDTILEDFSRVFQISANAGDYLTLNLSCPNTEAGGSCFQDGQMLGRLLKRIEAEQVGCPLFLKVTPLGGVPAIETLLESVEPFRFVSGFIFNTPAGKPKDLGLTNRQKREMPGAVTGPIHEPLMNLSIAELYKRMDRNRYRIIGVGGVFTAEDAYRKIRLGASLVQILTSLVYRGPGVVRSINQGLLRLLERDGLSRITDAVGVDVD